MNGEDKSRGRDEQDITYNWHRKNETSKSCNCDEAIWTLYSLDIIINYKNMRDSMRLRRLVCASYNAPKIPKKLSNTSQVEATLLVWHRTKSGQSKTS